MDLTISRRHVAQGRRLVSDRCPTALALKSVGFLDARVTTGVKWKTFTMPNSLRDTIEYYDAGGAFKTGTYRITGVRRPK